MECGECKLLCGEITANSVWTAVLPFITDPFKLSQSPTLFKSIRVLGLRVGRGLGLCVPDLVQSGLTSSG